MFHYFTNNKQLHNVLWVYSPDQSRSGPTRYYPGDSYVDIVGLDAYVDDPVGETVLSNRPAWPGYSLLECSEWLHWNDESKQTLCSRWIGPVDNQPSVRLHPMVNSKRWSIDKRIYMMARLGWVLFNRDFRVWLISWHGTMTGLRFETRMLIPSTTILEWSIGGRSVQTTTEEQQRRRAVLFFTTSPTVLVNGKERTLPLDHGNRMNWLWNRQTASKPMSD